MTIEIHKGETMGAMSVLGSVRLRRWGSASLVTLGMLVAFAAGALAQTTTGTIVGTVTDQKGLAMTGVNVVVHSDDTGIDQRPVATTDSGTYVVALLPPGNYDVTASQAGFTSVQNKGVTVQVGQTVRIDIEMPVQSQQSLVTVTTEAPLIETEKTEASQTVGENLVADLPISSRRWEQFVMLTPGLTTDGSTGLISYHGINSMFNNNSVDGANNNNSYQSAARGSTNDGYVYSSDSIKEFQVASGSYNAELGQAAGGLVNAVTKSGTSQIHGDLFYNMRNPIFNAIDPVTKANAIVNGLTPTQSVHQQNQFGGSVGGPILKDKLFYFVTYDGYRKSSPIAYTTSQSSPPISGLACPSEITAAQCGAAVGYILNSNLGTFARVLTQDVALGKIDYQLNQSNHLNGTFNWRNWYEPNGTSYASTANAGLTSTANSGIHDRFVIATWNTVIGSNKVNELLYQYGDDNSYSVNRSNQLPPSVTLSNLFGYGFNNVIPQFINETRHQVSDNFSFNMGRHAFKTGVDMNFIHTDVRTGMNVSGAYTYSNALSGSALTKFLSATGCSANTSDELFCGWLLDLYGKSAGDGFDGKHWTTFAESDDQRFPGDTNNIGAAQIFLENEDYAWYFQDTWKARPNLTVNMGLRYDFQLLPQLDPATATYAKCDTDTPLLAEYTCSTPLDWKGVQPRLGAAWNFRKSTVLRVGVGTFYGKTSVGTIASIHRTTGVREQSFNCATTGVNATGVCAGLIFPDVLFAQNEAAPGAPFNSSSLSAAQQPLTPVVVNPQGQLCTNNPLCAVRGLSPTLVNPMAIEGSLGIEQQLRGNMSVSVSYVFTDGIHLPTAWDVNMAAPASKTYDVLSSATAPATTALSPAIPFFDTRLNPTTGPILALFSNVNSWYNGLLVTLRKPMSHDVEMLVNYTFSKATDTGEASSNNGGEINLSVPGIVNPYNQNLEHAISALDDTHRLTASVVWAPSYGMKLSNRYERGALAGWNLSTTLTATSGNPYSGLIQSSATQSLSGVSGLDGGASASMLSTTVANMGGRVPWLARDSFRLPSYANLDARITRQFSIRERYKFEIRGEAFNLFNSTIVQAVNENAFNYVAAGTGVCAGHVNTCMVPVSAFQQPTTTSANLLGARQLQFGARFDF